MFLNNESHFANVPDIDISRSRMNIPFEHKTSFNFGQVIPVLCMEVYPGDTVKMKQSVVARLQTLLTPVMDNAVIDFTYFYTPNRILMNHWPEVMRENNSGPWAPANTYAVPTISAPSGGFAVHSIADYLGLPVGIDWNASDINAPSVLPFRGYAKICNEWWRDENLTYPLNIPLGDSNQTGTNGSSYINDVANGGMPFVASKTHDFFTSALPSAQKATAPVTFPLLSGAYAPVVTKNSVASQINCPPLTWSNVNTNGGFWSNDRIFGIGIQKANGGSGGTTDILNTDHDPEFTSDVLLAPRNLWADLNNNVGAVTVNELRLAFQLQKWYERSALAGSRLNETIKAFFNVETGDARLQRSEYLGGKRVPITINEVTNTSESVSSPLGNLGGKSNTADADYIFEHSFVEHGYLWCLVCARVLKHSYSQGIEKHWLRRTWSDYYWPLFAHLGEMPIKTAQIYADGYMNSDDIFGYQEAWAELRYKPSIQSSSMRPGVSGSLASWHFGDYYTQAPTLSDAWIREPVSNVDRTLAVTSAVADQVFGDFFFDMEWIRPMPVYSVPGLVDHF